MGQGYFIDTNILIYALEGLFTGNPKIVKIFNESFNISIISEIEFLGWKGFSELSKNEAKNFIDFASVYPITKEIKELTIKIKQNNNVKLADAVIAATAITHNFMLVTRNTKDFEKITNLKLFNPFQIA